MGAGNHAVFTPGRIRIETPYLHGGTGHGVGEIDSLPGDGLGGDAGRQGGKEPAEQGGFSRATGTGEDQVTLTAALESLPDTVGGWPEHRRLDRLHIVPATPFPALSADSRRRPVHRCSG